MLYTSVPFGGLIAWIKQSPILINASHQLHSGIMSHSKIGSVIGTSIRELHSICSVGAPGFMRQLGCTLLDSRNVPSDHVYVFKKVQQILEGTILPAHKTRASCNEREGQIDELVS